MISLQPRSRAWVETLLVAAALAPVLQVRAELPPLVPREVFLGNPVKTGPQISPDGSRLSYLAPSPEGVLNVWVRTIGKDDDRMVTHDTKRGIRVHFWAEDGKHLLYLQDVGGNENFHVYLVDPASAEAKDLTPFEGVRAQNLDLDRNHPDELLVGLNKRDPKVFDMYRIRLSTGELALEAENPGNVAGWMTDPEFGIRGAVASNQADGSQTLRVRDSAVAPWRDLLTWPYDENVGPVDFSADGRTLYLTSSLGSEVTRLVRLDLSTGKEIETVAADPRCDVGMPFVHPEKHTVQAVGFNYLRNEWKVLDPDVRDDFAALAKVRDGDFAVTSRDHADRTWIVGYTLDDGPVAYYAWDRAAKKAAFLFVNQPALEKAKLAKMEPVVIPARDGKKLVSYLTVPVGVPAKNLPMVLYVHGGPWARDNWGYNPMAQWLANRGYAVLQVNFRGSTGFGKAFTNAGNRQWGHAMQTDLSDAVTWAIGRGVADPKRVAIMGGSYGGYATLAGLTFTPELYACGVDIVGPSNIKTLFGAIPPYWSTMKKQMQLRVGDVEADSLWNRKISPLFHAGAIRAPLLVGQGKNDPRVNIREAEQIVTAMRTKQLPVEYIVYTDEGHGFARPENRLDFYGRAEQFLAKHIGGRAEPFTPVAGSTADVR